MPKLNPVQATKYNSFRNHSHRAQPGSFERLQYLQALLKEYTETDLPEYKEQIVANFANFSYDPRNSPHLLQLNILDLFCDIIKIPAEIWLSNETSSSGDSLSQHQIRLASFAVAGLANLSSASSSNRAKLLAHPCLPLLVCCLASPDCSIVVNTFTILIHLGSGNSLITEPSQSLGARFPSAKKAAEAYQSAARTSTLPDKRIGILASIFLEDCCTPRKIVILHK
ncbi:unnamed protein product [Protopolystoma xenopodis]|uniref:Armadillo repeat-containing domain-containing protein n=1 Tax=Protopolystoma xenopodis TaxID=117903 RepID=A0A448WW17_9PLAT|nr:unnamed protein product [Protopolystoma xenopodis]